MTSSPQVLDEIICRFLSKVEAPVVLQKSINFRSYHQKILSSLGCEKLNYFRIFAILLQDDWVYRWTTLGLFGSSLLNKHLETERATAMKIIMEGNEVISDTLLAGLHS